MDHLVTLVGEECGSSHEKPPIGISRGGIIDLPNGGRGAAKGYHLEDHGGKSWHPHSRGASATRGGAAAGGA